MATNVRTSVLADDVSLRFDGPWAAYVLALVRVLVGYWRLHAGLTTLLFGFGAEGYLKYASVGAITEPIMQAFASGAGLAFVNVMIPAGEFLIGLGLMLGAFVRLASFFGAFLLFFFYFTNHGWAHGMANGELWGIMLFVLLAVLGAGRVYGVDKYLESMPWAQDSRLAQYLLG